MQAIINWLWQSILVTLGVTGVIVVSHLVVIAFYLLVILCRGVRIVEFKDIEKESESSSDGDVPH